MQFSKVIDLYSVLLNITLPRACYSPLNETRTGVLPPNPPLASPKDKCCDPKPLRSPLWQAHHLALDGTYLDVSVRDHAHEFWTVLGKTNACLLELIPIDIFLFRNWWDRRTIQRPVSWRFGHYDLFGGSMWRDLSLEERPSRSSPIVVLSVAVSWLEKWLPLRVAIARGSFFWDSYLSLRSSNPRFSESVVMISAETRHIRCKYRSLFDVAQILSTSSCATKRSLHIRVYCSLWSWYRCRLKGSSRHSWLKFIASCVSINTRASSFLDSGPWRYRVAIVISSRCLKTDKARVILRRSESGGLTIEG